MQEYAIYKGDNYICSGTAKELSERFNIKTKTVQWLSTPANLRRIEESKSNKRLVAVKLNDYGGMKNNSFNKGSD